MPRPGSRSDPDTRKGAGRARARARDRASSGSSTSSRSSSRGGNGRSAAERQRQAMAQGRGGYAPPAGNDPAMGGRGGGRTAISPETLAERYRRNVEAYGGAPDRAMAIGKDQASNMMEAARLAEMMAPPAPRRLKDYFKGRQYVDDLYDEKPPVRKAVEALTDKLATMAGAKTFGPSLAAAGSTFGPVGALAGYLGGMYAGGKFGDMVNEGWDASGINPAPRDPNGNQGALPATPAAPAMAPAAPTTLYGAMPYTGYGALAPYGMV